jgi:hypothetical protein
LSSARPSSGTPSSNTLRRGVGEGVWMQLRQPLSFEWENYE